MSGDINGTVKLYSLKENNDKPVYTFKKVFDAQICDLKISNNGNIIAVTSKEGYEIKLIDLRK